MSRPCTPVRHVDNHDVSSQQHSNRSAETSIMIRPLLCFVMLMVSASQGECARKKVPDPRDPPPSQPPAVLRASRPSYLLGGRGGQREVRYLSVRVSNIGQGVAKDIQVTIEGASGLSFPLRGPKRLAPRADGVYISTVRVPIGVTLQPHAIVTCSTCRR